MLSYSPHRDKKIQDYYQIIVSKMYTGREEVLRSQKREKACSKERIE